MIKKTLFTLALFGLLCIAAPTWAGNAGLLLAPTRVVLENGGRYATVTVRNNGSATGRYKIEVVDTTMDENGGIKVNPEGKKDPFSALDMISLSPRSMTLRPDENQNVRILIKIKDDLPDGEYKSHLQVRMTESDLDEKTGGVPQKGVGIELKPKMTTVIPLIVRKGTTDFKVSLDDAKLVTSGGEKPTPMLKTSFSFSGNRSVLGDIKAVHIAPDGKETEIVFFRGIAIYRGITKRNQDVMLTIPAGVDIHKGKLLVSFMSQENEGSQVLTMKEITP